MSLSNLNFLPIFCLFHAYKYSPRQNRRSDNQNLHMCSHLISSKCLVKERNIIDNCGRMKLLIVKHMLCVLTSKPMLAHAFAFMVEKDKKTFEKDEKSTLLMHYLSTHKGLKFVLSSVQSTLK